MTEAERCKEKIAAARQHPELAAAMATPPPTWLGMGIGMSVIMVFAWLLTIAVMPSSKQMDQMPSIFRVQMMVAWVPMIITTVACGWLMFDAIGLAMQPTRYVIGVAEQRMHTPAPYYMRLITEDGADREYRARRRAASIVKLGLVEPGQVGVAIMKGDTILQFVPLPLRG